MSSVQVHGESASGAAVMQRYDVAPVTERERTARLHRGRLSGDRERVDANTSGDNSSPNGELDTSCRDRTAEERDRVKLDTTVPQFAACMPMDEAETIEPFAGYATPPAPARSTRGENAAGPTTRACTPGSCKTNAAKSTQPPLPTA